MGGLYGTGLRDGLDDVLLQIVRPLDPRPQFRSMLLHEAEMGLVEDFGEDVFYRGHVERRYIIRATMKPAEYPTRSPQKIPITNVTSGVIISPS